MIPDASGLEPVIRRLILVERRRIRAGVLHLAGKGTSASCASQFYAN